MNCIISRWIKMRKIKTDTIKVEKLAEETILVVSDVHLGYRDNKKNYCNKEQFDVFLTDILEKKISCNRLIVCGDFLDMWRRDIAGVILENVDTLNILEAIQETDIQVNLVVGNHDYYMRHFEKSKFGYKFTFHEGLKLINSTVEDSEFWFLHGDEFDILQNLIYYDALCFTNDEQGMLASDAWTWFLRQYSWIKQIWYRLKRLIKRMELPLQTADKRFNIHILDLIAQQARNSPELLSLPSLDEFPRTERKALEFAKSQEKLRVLVFGHTHQPFLHVTDKRCIGNPGTWENRSKVNNTFIKIENGELELCKFMSSENSITMLSTTSRDDGTRTLMSHQ